MDVMPAGSCGDGRHGAGAAEGIEHNVAPITIEFNQPVNQFLRERRGMAVFLLLRRFASAARWVKTLQEWLTTPCFGLDGPERVGELDELLAGNVGIGFVAFECPLAFGGNEDVFPTWHNVRIG